MKRPTLHTTFYLLLVLLLGAGAYAYFHTPYRYDWSARPTLLPTREPLSTALLDSLLRERWEGRYASTRHLDSALAVAARHPQATALIVQPHKGLRLSTADSLDLRLLGLARSGAHILYSLRTNIFNFPFPELYHVDFGGYFQLSMTASQRDSLIGLAQPCASMNGTLIEAVKSNGTIFHRLRLLGQDGRLSQPLRLRHALLGSPLYAYQEEGDDSSIRLFRLDAQGRCQMDTAAFIKGIAKKDKHAPRQYYPSIFRYGAAIHPQALVADDGIAGFYQPQARACPLYALRYDFPSGGSITLTTLDYALTNYACVRPEWQPLQQLLLAQLRGRQLLRIEDNREPAPDFSPDKANARPLAYALEQPALRYALYLLVAMAIAALVVNSRRRQRPLNHRPLAHNSTLSFVRQVATLFRLTSCYRSVLEAEQRLLLRDLSRRYRFAPPADGQLRPRHYLPVLAVRHSWSDEQLAAEQQAQAWVEELLLDLGDRLSRRDYVVALGHIHRLRRGLQA